MSLKRIKYLIAISILIFMISSVFSGIKIPPIVLDSKTIERGYYETFIFLITASIVLSFILFLSFIIKEPITRKPIRRGLKIIGISASVMGVVSVFCDLSALFSPTNLWGDFEFVLFFLLAVPSTVVFLIGFLMLIYGLIKSAG